MTRGLKARVKHILTKYPKTRDDDALLVVVFYEEYYYLTQTFTREKFLAVLKDASADDIVRLRRSIQRDALKHGINQELLPTNPEVIRLRRLRIDPTREVLGYPPERN